MGSNPIADTSGWESQCQEKKACSVAWGGFKIQASAADMCGWSHRESFRLSISNLAYSEPGSPFPDCREGLTDRLSSSVLLPGIEPRTSGKRDAAITTELIPAPVTGKGVESKGTPALAFSLSLFLIGPTLKTSPISQCHQQCLCHQQWLLVGSPSG